MLVFTALLVALMMVTIMLLAYQWLKWDWDRMSRIHRCFYSLLPWLPTLMLVLYNSMYHLRLSEYKGNLALTGSFALVVSGINIYRSLWAMLINLQLKPTRVGAGRLLLRISFGIVFTITGIVTLFALAYAMVIYLSGPAGVNQIVESAFTGQRLTYLEFGSCFYFSSVTYFSLGYGDFLPRGSIMTSLIYFESLLGYINSGILIAYAFNLFTKLNK